MAAGFGITYLTGIALNLEERVAFGAVLGAIAVTAASFVLSLVARDVTLLTVLLGLAIALAAAAAAVVRDLGQLRRDLADVRNRWMAPPRSPGHPWPDG